MSTIGPCMIVKNEAVHRSSSEASLPMTTSKVQLSTSPGGTLHSPAFFAGRVIAVEPSEYTMRRVTLQEDPHG